MFVRGGYGNFCHYVGGGYVYIDVGVNGDKKAEMLGDDEIYGFYYFGNY